MKWFLSKQERGFRWFENPVHHVNFRFDIYVLATVMHTSYCFKQLDFKDEKSLFLDSSFFEHPFILSLEVSAFLLFLLQTTILLNHILSAAYLYSLLLHDSVQSVKSASTGLLGFWKWESCVFFFCLLCSWFLCLMEKQSLPLQEKR